MNHKKVFFIIIFMVLWVWEGHADHLACSKGIIFKDKQYKCVVNHQTGKIWLDRNLGASYVAKSNIDIFSYGNYYQWGRPADGHESRRSKASNIQLSSLHLSTPIVQDLPISTLSSVILEDKTNQFITTHNDWLVPGIDDNGSKREVFFSRIDGTGVCP
ncbi:MAG: hypothetical protein LGB53_00970, partial [Sulfurovum sp.]|nr:hypothetical protein [Sulfurovum sp.]